MAVGHAHGRERRSRDAEDGQPKASASGGGLLLAVGLSAQFSNLASDYVHYGVMVRPGGLPGAGYLTGFYNSGTVVWVPP
jgi:hypothetical protein